MCQIKPGAGDGCVSFHYRLKALNSKLKLFFAMIIAVVFGANAVIMRVGIFNLVTNTCSNTWITKIYYMYAIQKIVRCIKNYRI